MEWKETAKELPPVNTLVRVLLTNGTKAIDFVNEPIDKETHFQHYLVSKWRLLTREELIEIVRKINSRDFRDSSIQLIA